MCFDYKIGDDIICIKNEYDDIYLKEHLTLNKSYKIVDIRTDSNKPLHFLIRDNNNALNYFDIDCFISIPMYREQQINKVLENE
jgi:hypothetical protein